MKNLFYGLVATVAFSSGAFANTHEMPVNEKVLAEKNIVSQVEAADVFYKDCKITVKGTVNGKEVNISVTVEANDCVDAAIKLIKGVVNEIKG
ncbi:hypothetical protein [Flavobacterium psychrotrophum]|uniref:hypothetical protein n=1 Tax=Flavobacterium psychrotrophum TaxID=2294119 RepID=UPI000E3189FE|nr:hypothetical protein [Flavobacterium psychrotrophum]